MGLYQRYVLPRLIHLACGTEHVMRQRAKVVPQARGRVLEVGVGSGLNLGLYDQTQLERLWTLEPAVEMIAMAKKRAAEVGIACEFLEAGAEAIPLEDASVDTVVLTYTLCTIPEAERSLREMARVLAPDGRMLFCEHGRAPDAPVRRWQQRIEPWWKPFAGGCHLTRDVPELLLSNGFDIETLEKGYLPGPRPMTFNTWGAARVATARE